MNRILITLTICVGLISLTGCFGSPQGQLEAMVKKESANLPMRIDEMTSMIGLEAKPLEVVYTYQLVGGGRVDQKQQEGTVRGDLVKNKEELASHAANKIKLTYIYQDEKKVELFRFTVNTWEL